MWACVVLSVNDAPLIAVMASGSALWFSMLCVLGRLQGEKVGVQEKLIKQSMTQLQLGEANKLTPLRASSKTSPHHAAHYFWCFGFVNALGTS